MALNHELNDLALILEETEVLGKHWVEVCRRAATLIEEEGLKEPEIQIHHAPVLSMSQRSIAQRVMEAGVRAGQESVYDLIEPINARLKAYLDR